MASGSGQGSNSEGPLPSKRAMSHPMAPMSEVSGGLPNDTDTDISETDITYQRTSKRTDLFSDEDNSQVYLCVIWQSGKLGVAHYDVDTTQLCMMPDTTETEDFQLLKRIIQEVQPKKVVISSKSDERLIKFLQSQVPAEVCSESVLRPTQGGGDGRFEFGYISMVPSIYFSVEICKRRILSSNLAGIPSHFNDSERSLYMSSLVPFDQIHMVRAVGGLLKLLDKDRVGVELESDDISVPVLSFQVFSVKDLMLVDDNTYSALQIFCRETHPSVYKAGSSNSAKEGLSLFGIMNRCRTLMGSKLLRRWFLHPSRDLSLLRDRQDAIAFFNTPRNAEVTASMLDCLKNIKSITHVLARMRQAQAPLGDWQALYKTAYNCIYIGDICRAQTVKIGIVKKIAETFTDGIHRIANLINKIVDFDESGLQNRFVVKPGVDPELDHRVAVVTTSRDPYGRNGEREPGCDLDFVGGYLGFYALQQPGSYHGGEDDDESQFFLVEETGVPEKRTYNGLPDFMTRVAKEELKKLHEEIKECSVMYLPQLGYLLAIPLCDFIKEDNEYQLPGLDFVFLSNGTVHYRSDNTKQLDSLLGDTQCDITDHETSIMHRLQNMILEHSSVLLDAMQCTAQLDCLLALAACAQDGNYVRPEVVADNVLDIKAGRHPLQELCCSPYVPNDTQSGGDHSRMKLLTGPNASGKSVYLKQVGLIVFMAHLGSFVPAESATIGMTDAIYSRIRTLESVSMGLSTFMIDLNQVSTAIRGATKNSLVILDEFGKGTETGDGVALLCACLEHWLRAWDNCPHIFVSTHFHSLVTQNLLPTTPLLQYQTMEVLQDGEELIFLYQLTEGVTNSSYACHIASLAGLPDEMVNRGSEVSDLLRRNQPVHRVDSSSTEAQLKSCEALVAKFMEVPLDSSNLETFLQDVVLLASESIR